jgi:hypothetical protein
MFGTLEASPGGDFSPLTPFAPPFKHITLFMKISFDKLFGWVINPK